jgi:hypothetical protein
MCDHIKSEKILKELDSGHTMWLKHLQILDWNEVLHRCYPKIKKAKTKCRSKNKLKDLKEKSKSIFTKT